MLATDTHDPKRRPPVLSQVVAELTCLIGEKRAQAMVNDIPQKIIAGEPCF